MPVDLTDPEQLDRLLRLRGRPDVIVHLAAETGTGQSLRAASRHGRVNVVGTTELLDALLRHDAVPARVVLTSSRAVYGEGRWQAADGAFFYPGPRTQEHLEAGRWDPVSPDGGHAVPTAHDAAEVWPRPTNVYAATKLAQEHVLQAWCASFGVDLVVTRLQNVYGPGQAVENSYTGVLTFFASRLASGHPIEVYEDGQIIRDFVFVDDVVRALASAVVGATGPYLLVDVGSGQPATLLDVAELMSRLAGGERPQVVGRYRLGDVRAAWSDRRVARDALVWEPATSLADGLAATLEWVRREVPSDALVRR